MGPCYYEFPRWKEAGLLQPIDTAKLKNWNKISPTLRNLPGISAGPGKVWFVPHYWGNTSLTIRTDLAPEYAKSQSWDILFDPKYKGRISVMEGVDDTVPFIARMIGVNAYEMSDADWTRVQAKLRELVGQLRFVSSDNTALAQGLASGELVAAMSWRSTFTALNREKKPVAYLTPPGGIFTYVCGLVMHKDAPNLVEKGAGADRSGRLEDRRRASIPSPRSATAAPSQYRRHGQGGQGDFLGSLARLHLSEKRTASSAGIAPSLWQFRALIGTDRTSD